MKRIILSAIFLLSLTGLSFAQDRTFPIAPEAYLTKGKLCDIPDSYRYPERIAYCERDVSKETKDRIIQDYDVKFGYRIRTMDRDLFKIDHFIPLCMGGSNDPINLWPQHKSLYTLTDSVEELLCKKLSVGLLTQKQAIDYIIQAKYNLGQVRQIYNYVNSL